MFLQQSYIGKVLVHYVCYIVSFCTVEFDQLSRKTQICRGRMRRPLEGAHTLRNGDDKVCMQADFMTIKIRETYLIVIAFCMVTKMTHPSTRVPTATGTIMQLQRCRLCSRISSSTGSCLHANGNLDQYSAQLLTELDGKR